MFRKYAFASALVFLCAMLAAATPARATDDDDEPSYASKRKRISRSEDEDVSVTTAGSPVPAEPLASRNGSAEKRHGCAGCASGGSGGWLAVVVLGLIVRRRRR